MFASRKIVCYINSVKPEQIKQWRESKGLDRKQLAALCSASPATVANWELGRNTPHGAAADRLQKMISGEVSVMPLTPQEERLLDELVSRHGFESREAFLTEKLLEAIKSPITQTPKKAPKVAKRKK